jgi:general secretion pathway protein D
MVMGGLIGENRANDSEGLPWVSRIPIIGGLFGNQKLKNDRTELVLFITPRVVESQADVVGAIEDLRRKFDNLDRLFPIIKPFADMVFPPPPSLPPAAPAQMPIPQIN